MLQTLLRLVPGSRLQQRVPVMCVMPQISLRRVCYKNYYCYNVNCCCCTDTATRMRKAEAKDPGDRKAGKCLSGTCLLPKSNDWIQCYKCFTWFHCFCVGEICRCKGGIFYFFVLLIIFGSHNY